MVIHIERSFIKVKMAFPKIQLPKMLKIRQVFPLPRVEDVQKTVRGEIEAAGLRERVRPGGRIAITAGSRGISCIREVIKATVDTVREMGCQPFIVPAMGSHGGATAEGQREVLRGYGIEETTVGAPIISSMETVKLGETEDGIGVFFDKHAASADGVILVNRIKPHPDFFGRWESGLVKMAVVGLGKHQGALAAHTRGAVGLRDDIPKAFDITISKTPIVLGIGIVENAKQEPAEIRALPPREIKAREPELLIHAKELCPKIPTGEIRVNLLIVDRIGKDISGTGMDAKVIGRIRLEGIEEPKTPVIDRIVVRDLTEKSHGNALGVGLADFTTEKFLRKVDFESMSMNVITSTFLERGKIPLVMPNDEEAIRGAIHSCRSLDPTQAKIVRIANTLDLEELWVSLPLWEELREWDDIEKVGEPVPLRFSPAGDLM
ncbi:MAG: lactate racemase domain-containing protein [bacterium]